MQIAVILNGFIKVWYSSLEYIFYDTFDDDVLLCGKLGMIEVTNGFQDDVLFELFLFIVLVRVNSDLAIYRLELTLRKTLVIPQLII